MVNNLAEYGNSSQNSKVVKNILQQACLNQIFKKILLENNRWNDNKFKMKTLLSNPLDKELNYHRTRVFVCSDALKEEEIEYDQKLVFLMKRQGIYVDCLSIGQRGDLIVSLKLILK